jgi:phytoene desaturase
MRTVTGRTDRIVGAGLAAALHPAGRPVSGPSLPITRPAATGPGLAPPGRQLFSIFAPVPNLRRGPRDGDRDAGPYAGEVLGHVRARLLPGFEPDLTHVPGPAGWQRRGLVAGTPSGYAHSFVQTGPFRPWNLPRGTENVVLAGGGTVPGVSVPAVLLSGRPAAARSTGAARTIDLTAERTR